MEQQHPPEKKLMYKRYHSMPVFRDNTAGGIGLTRRAFVPLFVPFLVHAVPFFCVATIDLLLSQNYNRICWRDKHTQSATKT